MDPTKHIFCHSSHPIQNCIVNPATFVSGRYSFYHSSGSFEPTETLTAM